MSIFLLAIQIVSAIILSYLAWEYSITNPNTRREYKFATICFKFVLLVTAAMLVLNILRSFGVLQAVSC